MSENTKIEWCDSTFNPWEGCTKVSPGCAHCYAENRNSRWNKGNAINWGKGAPRRRTSEANWKLPLKWNQQAAFENAKLLGKEIRPRVFCASLADWLDDEVPIEWLADLLNLIRLTPNLDWLLLSKRPENWKPRIEDALNIVSEKPNAFTRDTAANSEWWNLRCWLDNSPPSNVWIGTTVENQEMADKRIPLLLSIPSRVRFLSCEPMLESVDLNAVIVKDYDFWFPSNNGIHWVICGGESGPKARPMNIEWARTLRDQCQDAGIPFFMKQMGGIKKPFPPIPDDLNIKQYPA